MEEVRTHMLEKKGDKGRTGGEEEEEECVCVVCVCNVCVSCVCEGRT